MFDEVWFDSMSTFVTKFCSLNNEKNCFAIAPGDELKIFWLNPQGDEVLIKNGKVKNAFNPNCFKSIILDIQIVPFVGP